MVLKIILGFILILFFPGFLISHLLFKKLSYLEQITVGIFLSIIIAFLTSIFLGMFKSDKFFYSFTPNNILISLITISVTTFIILLREALKKR